MPAGDVILTLTYLPTCVNQWKGFKVEYPTGSAQVTCLGTNQITTIKSHIY